MLTKLPINLLLGVLSFSTAYAQAEDAGSKIQFPVTGGVVSGPTRVNFTFYGTNSLAEQDGYRLINVGVYNDEWDYESGSASAIPSEGIRVLFEASSYLAAVGDGIRYDAPAAVFDVPGDDGLPDDYVFILSVIGDDETTTPGDDDTTTSGDDETTTSGDDDTTTPGDTPTIKTSTGKDSQTTTGGSGSSNPTTPSTSSSGSTQTTSFETANVEINLQFNVTTVQILLKLVRV
ncbi:uncharacterized protein CYBJADRAFT_181884 [Cyberlindnera jadinii NRRL Y-1542]|uniref:Uncharacterized protein n=1 Tax=Cyberlindnera jadinii (strain ATCC 18201 / CBS 1600 / BCRC 20928 / JCM 3617 / NBRC 0987 / NRRL Y-1542) TaxID=983966 RepID=A0A1E4S021_CYBJN|nr:hypothetical protein CYBJADRAFT_181884 [Cyberlindnera jadinii NRRL Y-1542]ODV72795.1 hypothetical protein CYBJADRAFT_181884 [Cyberlindnera jadinii NRRL Y-1542]